MADGTRDTNSVGFLNSLIWTDHGLLGSRSQRLIGLGTEQATTRFMSGLYLTAQTSSITITQCSWIVASSWSVPIRLDDPSCFQLPGGILFNAGAGCPRDEHCWLRQRYVWQRLDVSFLSFLSNERQMSLAALGMSTGRLSQTPVALYIVVFFGGNNRGAENRQGQVHLTWFCRCYDLSAKHCEPLANGAGQWGTEAGEAS